MLSMYLKSALFVVVLTLAVAINADSSKNTINIGDCAVTIKDDKPNFKCEDIKECSHTLTLGGATGGTYEVIANIISGIAHATGTLVGSDCAAVEIDSGSAGSQENCKKVLDKPKYELGIVQSDVFFDSKDGCYSGSENNFVVLHELHDEYIHILARTSIENIQSLEGKVVSIGEEGSGTIFTARNVLAAHGVNVSERKYSTANALNKLLSDDEDSIDAMFYVGGVAGSIFKENRDRLTDVHFLPVTVALPSESFEDASFTVNDYDFIRESEVKTWKQKALLITYNWDTIDRGKTCDLVRRLSNKIDQHTASINNLYPIELFGGPFERTSPNSGINATLRCD